MKKPRFTESQIIKAVKDHDSGRDLNELCLELGIHRGTVYLWKKKYGGMEDQELKRLKELEEENRKFKQMYVELALDNRILRMFSEKSFRPCWQAPAGKLSNNERLLNRFSITSCLCFLCKGFFVIEKVPSSILLIDHQISHLKLAPHI